MPLSGTRTYVGFGFGAIQSGLLLLEAWRSGNFGRLVVAEVVPEVVTRICDNQGRFRVNVAHADRIEAVELGPIEVLNPAVVADRGRLVEAVAEASEMGTAVPSVRFYTGAADTSLARILAAGLKRKRQVGGPPAIVYAAENHNAAAETLEEAVKLHLSDACRSALPSTATFLNTVIGKMSGIVTDLAEISMQQLATVTPNESRAFLVEAFNRILISRVPVSFDRGIEVFEEKANLLPFEEAKLYGHNATHALAAYLANLSGLEQLAQLRDEAGAMCFLRAAFLDESGASLVKKHGNIDPLFTSEGYARYADDLLERMTCPFLRDTVERVARDPHRKLGWHDRLVGTIRLSLRQQIEPRRYALGTAAAAKMLTPGPVAPQLQQLWHETAGQEKIDAAEEQAVLELIAQASSRLDGWQTGNWDQLESLVG